MTTTATKSRTCDICNETITIESGGWADGHNAEPVVANGRCCGECNALVVIPRRLEEIYGLQR